MMILSMFQSILSLIDFCLHFFGIPNFEIVLHFSSFESAVKSAAPTVEPGADCQPAAQTAHRQTAGIYIYISHFNLPYTGLSLRVS